LDAVRVMEFADHGLASELKEKLTREPRWSLAEVCHVGQCTPNRLAVTSPDERHVYMCANLDPSARDR
jgi:hypothetical protein